MKKISKYSALDDRGLVKMILLIIVILLVLSYFGLNLRSLTNSSTFTDNWDFIKTTMVNVWHNYLQAPCVYVWNTWIVPYVITPIMSKALKQS